MRSMQLVAEGPGLALLERDVPRPSPGAGELLVRVTAAGVTRTEFGWYPTSHTKSGELRSNAVPGHEFSGVVAATGEGVTEFGIGEAVYGMNDWFADGATAEYCLTLPSSIAAKPARLTHAEAASVPIGALTAWQGLLDRAAVKAGERVLVHGGAGGVGVFAVQLARLHGARVAATVAARNAEFVRELGAEETIDYRRNYFGEYVARFDVVFDAVGGETRQRSWALLRPGGRLVTVAADGEQTEEERVKQAYFIVEPDRRQLVKVAELIDSGELKAIVDTTVPLDRAAEAYAGRLAERRGRGKVVIAVAEE